MDVERYRDWSLDLHRRVVAQRTPADGTIEVTRRCPLACAHCYNNLPVSDRAARRGELSLDEHHRIVDEIAEAGCLWLLYTGGEIFARADFLDIYTHAKQAGLIVTLFTNGTMITPRIADYLLEWRPFAIEITLYGRRRETYERLTGVPGSYDRCLRGVRLLKERGLPLKLKTVAVSINKHEVWEMQRFAEDELGVPFKLDAMVNPRIDCSASPLAVRLTPAEVVAFDLEDDRRAGEWQRFCEQFHGPAHVGADADRVYACGGGVNSFAVDPEGKLSICTLSHRDVFDLRQGSFREGWEQFLRRVRERKATRLTKCRACAIKSMCGMCPANGELENGDPESPVDFLCHVAHLRAATLGIEVPAHGECEYCPGGERHGELQRSLAGLGRARELIGSPGKRTAAPAPLALPVLGAAGGRASACGSCGTCGPTDLLEPAGVVDGRVKA